MKIHKEIKQIMQQYKIIDDLILKLSKKINTEGLYFSNAELVELTDDQIKRYKDDFNNDYLVEQHTGYYGDYYGYVYFATKEKNKFIKVYFAF